MPMIPLSQGVRNFSTPCSESNQGIIIYIPRFYRSPLKYFFSFHCTVFKLILLQYDTSLSNNFDKVT